MLSALNADDPVVFLEHKLLADYWLDYLGGGSRTTVRFDVPSEGADGSVPDRWETVPIGRAAVRRNGRDLTLTGVGVGVHRSLEAAARLEQRGVSAEVLDLRSVVPLDEKSLLESVSRTGRLLVVDEDYRGFGLSGELSAVVMETGIPFRFARVCTDGTIPYSRMLEDEALPNVRRITEAALRLVDH